MTVDVASLVSDNLDIWTTAVERRSGVGRGSGKRIDLYGLNRLRSLILALAVNGKLVGGNGAVKHGVLDDVGDWVSGNGFPKEFQGSPTGDIPFLKVSDMNLPGNERVITVSNNSVSPDGLKAMRARAHPAGTIIFPKIGGAIATNKRRILSIPSAIDNNCAGQIPRKGINPDWLFMVLTSIDMSAYQAGTSVPALNMKRLAQHAIAIPDEQGQVRIIAKVDELMALCDALEAESGAAMAAHQALVEALLATLTASTDAADLATNWARLEAHFDTLFTTEASVDALKQTVLELAVRGKLVPHMPSEGSGLDLLQSLKVCRRKLGLKNWNPKATQSDEHLFANAESLPKHWALAKLGDITTNITDGTHQTPKYLSDGVAFISVKDIDGQTISFSDCRLISEEEHRSINSRCSPQRDDILICRIGTLGRPTIVDTDRPFSLFVSVGLIKYVLDEYCARYQHLVLSSPALTRQYDAIKAGGSHTNKLNLGDLPRLEIPLPPLAEQWRIVAKVDELLALCDQLRFVIADSASMQRRLAETVVERAAV